MKTNFSPSINIIRDANKDLKYIPTSNTRRIFHQIVNDYKIGTRSFNIIGSYGTGKSAFLLNFERNLQGERKDFEAINGQFGNVNGFEIWNVIGEYKYLSRITLIISPQRHKEHKDFLTRVFQKCFFVSFVPLW